MAKSLTEFANRHVCWVCTKLTPALQTEVVAGSQSGIGMNNIANWLEAEHGITISASTASRSWLAKHIKEHHAPTRPRTEATS